MSWAANGTEVPPVVPVVPVEPVVMPVMPVEREPVERTGPLEPVSATPGDAASGPDRGAPAQGMATGPVRVEVSFVLAPEVGGAGAGVDDHGAQPVGAGGADDPLR